MSQDDHAKEAERLMKLVANAMEEQAVTQAELARRTGYGRPYISRLFKVDGDKRVATLPTALHLANALGLVTVSSEEGV